MAHCVETKPFEMENITKLITLKTSLPKIEVGSHSRANPIVVKMKNVLKTDKNITTLGENTLIPPEYLPTVSKTLNNRMTISVYHDVRWSGSINSRNSNYDFPEKNAPGNTTKVTIKTQASEQSMVHDAEKLTLNWRQNCANE